MTGGTYINQYHRCFASTGKGCILIFGNTLYSMPFEEEKLDNSKIFISAVKLFNVSIECLITVDQYVYHT